MALTGDFSRLAQLRQRFEGAAALFISHAKTRMASAAQQQIVDEFNSATNPSGRPWAPRKHNRGQWPLLMKKKRNGLVDSVRTIPTARGLRVTMKYYGKFLNDGTVNMVARRIVPVNGELPPRWSRAFHDACDEAAQAVGL